jgi:hypothetical protein
MNHDLLVLVYFLKQIQYHSMTKMHMIRMQHHLKKIMNEDVVTTSEEGRGCDRNNIW